MAKIKKKVSSKKSNKNVEVLNKTKDKNVIKEVVKDDKIKSNLKDKKKIIKNNEKLDEGMSIKDDDKNNSNKANVDDSIKKKNSKKNLKLNEDFLWKIISIVSIIVFLGLILMILNKSEDLIMMNHDNMTANTKNINSNDSISNSNHNVSDMLDDTIKVLVIEDPNCQSCQVDIYLNQIKEFLIPDLEINKLSYEDVEAKKIIEEIKISQLPVYLFSMNLDKRNDWSTNLYDKFIKISVSSKEYYILNPLYVPLKVLINEPIINDSTIVIGNEDAKLTIYQFSDYACPFCGLAEGNKVSLEAFKSSSEANLNYVSPMPEIFKNYIDTGKIKFVFYNMPVDQLNSKVRTSHLAALCAKDQNKWLEFHNKLFFDRDDWINEDSYGEKMEKYAKNLSLNIFDFNDCLDSKKYNSQINEEIEIAKNNGIAGTPAFIIGKIFVPGALDYTVFKNIIDAELEAIEN